MATEAEDGPEIALRRLTQHSGVKSYVIFDKEGLDSSSFHGLASFFFNFLFFVFLFFSAFQEFL